MKGLTVGDVRVLLFVALAALGFDLGCPAWDWTIGDGGMDLPAGRIVSPLRYLTLQEGESLEFTSEVTCPRRHSPCRYAWDFGNGQTSDKKDPGTIVFSSAGFFPVTFTVTSASRAAASVPSVVNVAVWKGEFSDDFNRRELRWERDGWQAPIVTWATDYYQIENNWLHVTGDIAQPGGTALLSMPAVQDFSMEVTKRREPDTTIIHFSDVIMRMHPTRDLRRFIRARFAEYTNGDVAIAIFKIDQEGDQHGFLILDGIMDRDKRHADCDVLGSAGQCPTYANFPRHEDLQISVSMTGPKITVDLALASSPGKTILTATGTDDIGPPYTYEGFVGLAQFSGITDFDNYLLRRR